MPRQTLYQPPHPQLEPWPPEPPREGILGEEPPKEVYREACAKIGLALQSLGFKYLKSKQNCRRIRGPVENEITFRTSHFNASGYHVQLWMHATVVSPELQVWRAQRLPDHIVTGHIAGGMVHRLGSRFALVQWELVDPEDREETISDAVDFIRSEVIPYFSQFDAPELMASSLATRAVPAFDLVSSVEFAYCFGSKAHAQAVLDHFVSERPHFASAIAAEKLAPPPPTSRRYGTYAQQVIFLREQYDLE